MIAFRTNEWRKAVDYKAVAVVQCCVKNSKRFCIAQIVFPKWAHKCPSTIGITFWNLIFFDAVGYRSSHCYDAPTILAERVRHFVLAFLRGSLCEKPTIHTYRNSLRKIPVGSPYAMLKSFDCKIFASWIPTLSRGGGGYIETLIFWENKELSQTF